MVIIAGITIALYSLTYTESAKLPMEGSIYNQNNTDYIESFRVPKYIPDGYELYTYSNAPPSTLELDYRPINRDEFIRDGIIFVAEKDNPNIEKGIETFLDFKANSQRGNLVQIFEINGNPAMGWEAGVKNTVLIFDNGTKRIIGETSYDAAIAMIDQNEHVYYSISSPTLPLEELKKMMESIYQ
ncbi:MAG: hypothetical protein KatS3mg003_1446 [Candidatus Nitrosocaldaceae archaeon]|nr:MAG: hypothetical protein KatS3mg003_1446 [Candidatus Nitrosocaldaceae archaeon]